MPWLLILLALAAFAGAFLTDSMILIAGCLLAALTLLAAGVLWLLANRAGSRSRDDAALIDVQQLRRLREQAEARARAAPESLQPPAA